MTRSQLSFDDKIIAEIADIAEFAAMRGITYLEAVGYHWGRGHWWIRQQITSISRVPV